MCVKPIEVPEKERDRLSEIVIQRMNSELQKMCFRSLVTEPLRKIMNDYGHDATYSNAALTEIVNSRIRAVVEDWVVSRPHLTRHHTVNTFLYTLQINPYNFAFEFDQVPEGLLKMETGTSPIRVYHPDRESLNNAVEMEYQWELLRESK